MITIITGIPGAGKTAHLCYLLVQRMIEHGFEDYAKCVKEIKKLNAGGFDQLSPPPFKHVCYSDFDVKVNSNYHNYYIDGFKIGLPNPYFDTTFIPPYSNIFLDEAQRYYNSRMSKYLRDEVYGFYQLHRHNHYNIFMACQRLGNIDVNIRSIAERILVIDKIDVEENDWGMPINITWTIREFVSCDTAEAYMLARERKENLDIGKIVVESTNLSIFDFYNSHSMQPAFFEYNYDREFDYYTEEGYEFTKQGFADFNSNHYFIAPRGYWKNTDYDKAILKNLGAIA